MMRSPLWRFSAAQIASGVTALAAAALVAVPAATTGSVSTRAAGSTSP